jgi:hypothetical protein
MSFESDSNRLPGFDLEWLVTGELVLFLVCMFVSVIVVDYRNRETALWLMLGAMLLLPLTMVVGVLRRRR